ncbi:initiation factor 2 [Clavulina sp. PMI_390]|nr:initiation factor 2 [Clavulina sp. PMI_390]
MNRGPKLSTDGRTTASTSWSAERRGRPGATAKVAPNLEQQAEESDAVEAVEWSKPSQSRQNSNNAHQDRRKKGLKGSGNFFTQKDNSPSTSRASLQPIHAPKQHKPKAKLVEKVSPDVYIPENVTVANLARLLGVSHKHLVERMADLEMEGMSSADYMLTADDAYVIALEFDRNPIIDDQAAFDLYPLPLPEDQSSLPLKPPVITIMGHVDHGKTTLLDTLRSASVASGEAGGITQHIGAFSVPVGSLSTSSSTSPSEGSLRSITFLDTPGHAAFSAMRARGASATDIIVLVVAADDGVMPQTREVIRLAKKDMGEDGNGVGLVVALNKMDKHGVDPSEIKKALLAEGVELEEFGGEIPCVEVSGMTGLGLDKLVDTLSTLAEIKELRARATGRAEGRILESRVDKGRGSVATVLVTQGELTAGSHIVAGTTWARVRQMQDSTGKNIRSAPAGTPVTISGWKELPDAGDEVLEGKESEVKTAVENRKRNIAQMALQKDVASINEKRLEAKAKGATDATSSTSASTEARVEAPASDSASEVKELRLLIKADVSGSAEAVQGALEDIGNDVAKTKIISASVGEPTEADIEMAKAVGATVVGFSVKPSNKIINYAAAHDVPLITNSIIYRLMEDVRSRVQGLLPPVIEQRVLGEATVQQIFDIKGKGKTIIKIAGCRVANGVIDRSKKVRVMRDGDEVFAGSLDTLRHIKKDITEARKGSECGLSICSFGAFVEGDKIQSYEEIEKLAQL